MAFQKKSISMTRPVAVTLEEKSGTIAYIPGSEEVPSVGDEKNGRVWDGEKWVPKTEWEASQASH